MDDLACLPSYREILKNRCPTPCAESACKRINEILHAYFSEGFFSIITYEAESQYLNAAKVLNGELNLTFSPKKTKSMTPGFNLIPISFSSCQLLIETLEKKVKLIDLLSRDGQKINIRIKPTSSHRR